MTHLNQLDIDRTTDREIARLTDELQRSREARQSEQRIAEAWMSKCLKAEEQHAAALAMVRELADVASWYQSLHNDVTNTTPEYFDLCGDLNAVLYLQSEAQRIHEQAKALIKAQEAQS